MIERVEHDGRLLALIVRRDFTASGIQFFTPNEFSQQLAYMAHPAGKKILPHRHNPVPREVQYTQEVLVIRSGILRADFYDSDMQYIGSRMLGAGDVILLAQGGHGFEVIEPVEMFEIKQGPYAGEADKTRFTGIEAHQVKIG
jgi:hypothetical protein